MTGPRIEIGALAGAQQQLEGLDKVVQNMPAHFQQAIQSIMQAGATVNTMVAELSRSMSGLAQVTGGGAPVGVAQALSNPAASSTNSDFARHLAARQGDPSLATANLAASPLIGVRQHEFAQSQAALAAKRQEIPNLTGSALSMARRSESILAGQVEASKARLADAQTVQALADQAHGYMARDPRMTKRDLAWTLGMGTESSAWEAVKRERESGATIDPILVSGHVSRAAELHAKKKEKDFASGSGIPLPPPGYASGQSWPDDEESAKSSMYGELAGKAFYSPEERRRASMGIAVHGKSRAMGYDLTDVAAISAQAGKLDQLGLTSMASKAQTSADPMQQALGAQLSSLVTKFAELNGQLSAATVEFTKHKSGSAESRVAMERLKEATLKVADVQEQIKKTKDQLPPGGGEGDDGAPIGRRIQRGIGALTSAISAVGTATGLWYTTEAALYGEGTGKERGMYEATFAKNAMIARQGIEQYDLTNPANLLKTRGSVIFPGRYKFLGASGLGEARALADRETEDTLRASEAQYRSATWNALTSAGVGAAKIAAGALIGIGSGGLGLGVGLVAAASGVNDLMGAYSSYTQMRAQNQYSQLGGGLAGTLAGTAVLGGSEAERRALLNRAYAQAGISAAAVKRADELRNREAEDPNALLFVSQWQSMKETEQQGAELVGRYAWRRDEMMNALYGGPVSGAETLRRPFPRIGESLQAPIDMSRRRAGASGSWGTSEVTESQQVEALASLRDRFANREKERQQSGLGAREWETSSAASTRDLYRAVKESRENEQAYQLRTRQEPEEIRMQHMRESAERMRYLGKQQASIWFMAKEHGIDLTQQAGVASVSSIDQPVGEYRPYVPAAEGGRISSRFGLRRDPFGSGALVSHEGIDEAAPMGTPIRAPRAGTVKRIGRDTGKKTGYGNLVEVAYSSGMSEFFGHMQSAPELAVGDTVAEGQLLGRVGSTGRSTGPHLHRGLRNAAGRLVNPMAGETGIIGPAPIVEDELTARATVASELGMTPERFMANANMLTNVLGSRGRWSGVTGIRAGRDATAEMTEMGRSGLGSYGQLLGNLSALNQVSGGQDNTTQLKEILSYAVTLGFDRSRTAQQFVQTSVGIADALRLTRVDKVAGVLASTALYTGATPGLADERSLRQSAEGIKGFQAWSGQESGVLGALRFQGVLAGGGSMIQAGILKGASVQELGEIEEQIRTGEITNASGRMLVQSMADKTGRVDQAARDRATKIVKNMQEAVMGPARSIYSATVGNENLNYGQMVTKLLADKGTAGFDDLLQSHLARMTGINAQFVGLDRASAAAAAVDDAVRQKLITPGADADRLKQQMKESQDIFRDMGQIQMSRFTGEIMRRGQGSVTIGTDPTNIKNVYGTYLKEGGQAMQAMGVPVNREVMGAMFDRTNVEAVKTKYHITDIDKVKDAFVKDISTMQSIDLAKMQQAAASPEAQSVNIANTVQLAQDIARIGEFEKVQREKDQEGKRYTRVTP